MKIWPWVLSVLHCLRTGHLSYLSKRRTVAFGCVSTSADLTKLRRRIGILFLSLRTYLTVQAKQGYTPKLTSNTPITQDASLKAMIARRGVGATTETSR